MKKPLKKESGLHIPPLRPVFPARRHPEAHVLEARVRALIDTVIDPAADQTIGRFGEYLKCCVAAAYMYSAPRYPIDRVTAIGAYYAPLTYTDDVADASLDLDEVNALMDQYAAAVRGEPVTDPVFTPVKEFFAHPAWHPDLQPLAVQANIDYSDAVRAFRTLEIHHQPVTVNEYFDIRVHTIGLLLGCLNSGFAWPDGHEEFYAAYHTDTYQRAVRYLAAALVVECDLYALHVGRPQVIDWANIIAIIQRATGEECTQQQAANAAIALFYRLDAHTYHTLCELAADYPNVAESLADNYAGSFAWVDELRVHGNRYRQPESILAAAHIGIQFTPHLDTTPDHSTTWDYQPTLPHQRMSTDMTTNVT